MAALPNTPINSAATVGILAGIALIGYTATLRHKLDAQIHENYRHAKLVDAGVVPDSNTLKLAQG